MKKLNKIGQSQILAAAELGIKSFENGQSGVPAHNEEIFKIVGYRMKKDTPKGECTITDIMKSYCDAWHNANLANARKLLFN